MNRYHRRSVPVGVAILSSALAFAAWGTARADQDSSIFTYDGQDFVRTHTTLMTEDGKPAIGTKLDHDSPAYLALTHNHSYTGDVTVFGKSCHATYAPVDDDSGKVTGALFVCFK